VTGECAAGELSETRTALALATARAEELQRALVTSRQIGMAIGILMERQRLTAEQAFDCLRDLSQRRNVKLRDVAEQIIYTGGAEQRRD
jgi:AmiR/NasT family two-component response regulator